MIRVYCEGCGSTEPVIMEPCQADDLNGDKIWGDMLCATCRLVLMTMEVDQPGQYEIVAIGPAEDI